MNDDAKQSYCNSEGLSRIFRALAGHARSLDTKLLAGADEVEIGANGPWTGKLLDGLNTTSVISLKRFSKRWRQEEITLRVRAHGDVADRICADLGPPDFYRRTEGRERVEVRDWPLEAGAREIIFLASGEVFAWTQVAIHWPRDPEGRALLRGALVIVIVPRPLRPESSPSGEAVPSEQLGLTF